MKHANLRWNPGTRQWFCTTCGRASDQVEVQDAYTSLEKYECRVPSVESPRAVPGTETVRLMRKPFKMTLKTERSGCRFVVTESDEGPEIKLELFHDAPSLKALAIGFEMLRGVTLAQARTLVEAMNERIVGVIVAPK